MSQKKYSIVDLGHPATIGGLTLVFDFSESNLTIEEAAALTVAANKAVALELVKMIGERQTRRAQEIVSAATADLQPQPAKERD